MKIELELAETVYADLQRIAADRGVSDLPQMLAAALIQWSEAHIAELANRDPAQRYFINEALDELLERQKKAD